MKKKKFSAKLNLNKQSISKLNNANLDVVKGGRTGNACPINISDFYFTMCNCIPSVNRPCADTDQPGCTA